jgi:hypothetical protein
VYDAPDPSSPVDPHAAWARRTSLLAILGVVATPLLVVGLSPDRCVESEGVSASLACGAGPECCTPLAQGLAGGVLIGLPLFFLLGRIVRGGGGSRPAGKRDLLRYTALVLAAEIGIVAGRLFL